MDSDDIKKYVFPIEQLDQIFGLSPPHILLNQTVCENNKRQSADLYRDSEEAKAEGQAEPSHKKRRTQEHSLGQSQHQQLHQHTHIQCSSPSELALAQAPCAVSVHDDQFQELYTELFASSSSIHEAEGAPLDMLMLFDVDAIHAPAEHHDNPHQQSREYTVVGVGSLEDGREEELSVDQLIEQIDRDYASEVMMNGSESDSECQQQREQQQQGTKKPVTTMMSMAAHSLLSLSSPSPWMES